jgi:hypothetical protein
MKMAIRPVLLGIAGLSLAACNGYGFGGMGGSAPSPDPERVVAFTAMLEGAGCELPHTDNDALLASGGFSDAEASAISQQLVANGSATIAPNGNLLLQSGACL